MGQNYWSARLTDWNFRNCLIFSGSVGKPRVPTGMSLWCSNSNRSKKPIHIEPGGKLQLAWRASLDWLDLVQTFWLSVPWPRKILSNIPVLPILCASTAAPTVGLLFWVLLSFYLCCVLPFLTPPSAYSLSFLHQLSLSLSLPFSFLTSSNPSFHSPASLSAGCWCPSYHTGISVHVCRVRYCMLSKGVN